MDFLENSRSDFIRNCFFRHHRHVCMQCIYATSQTEQAKSGKGEDLGMPSMLWFNTSVAFGFLYLFIVTIDSKEYDCCLNNMFFKRNVDLLSVYCYWFQGKDPDFKW